MEKRIYCLIPRELAGRLHDTLRRHFSDDRQIEVVVEERRRERRSGVGRRLAVGRAPGGKERRRIRNRSGRRVGDRRAPQIELAPDRAPALPRRARRYAERIVFVERLAPSTEAAEDLDTARIVGRIQAGERELFSEIYMRYFDRLYSYLCLLLRDRHEAEDALQQVFVRMLEQIDRYERQRQPFRAWLFVIARNIAYDILRRRGRSEPHDPGELARSRESLPDQEGARALAWISDQDLLVLMERLPMAQKQVLALRFLLGMRSAEIAEVLEMSPSQVRGLQSRALKFLRTRLVALTREPQKGHRTRMRRWGKQATVLRRRRYALLRR